MIDAPHDSPHAHTEVPVENPPELFLGFRFWTRQHHPGVYDIIIDPHAGACHGDHNILVSVFGGPFLAAAVAPVVSWGASILLSPGGVASFGTGLQLALAICEQLQHGAPFDLDAAMTTVVGRL